MLLPLFLSVITSAVPSLAYSVAMVTHYVSGDQRVYVAHVKRTVHALVMITESDMFYNSGARGRDPAEEMPAIKTH